MCARNAHAHTDCFHFRRVGGCALRCAHSCSWFSCLYFRVLVVFVRVRVVRNHLQKTILRMTSITILLLLYSMRACVRVMCVCVCVLAVWFEYHRSRAVSLALECRDAYVCWWAPACFLCGSVQNPILHYKSRHMRPRQAWCWLTCGTTSGCGGAGGASDTKNGRKYKTRRTRNVQEWKENMQAHAEKVLCA